LRTRKLLWLLSIVVLAGVVGASLAWRQGLLLGPRLEEESPLFGSFASDLLRLLGRRDLPPELGAYRQLAAALARWPAGLGQVRQLAERVDGVGYQACLLLARSQAARQDGTAAQWYLRALDLRPDPGVREELARLLDEQGNTAAAIEHWKELLPAATAVAALLRLQPERWQVAAWLNDRGWADRALDLLREGDGETRARADARVAREWGRALLTLGDARAALPWLARYLGEFPHDTQTLGLYARALEATGKLEAAREAYQRLGPAGARGLGRVLERLGRKGEAARAYLESPEAEARWRGALLLEEQGLTSRALEVYGHLATEKSTVQDDAALRGYLLARQRGDRDAAHTFRAAVSPGLAWCAGLPLAQPLPYQPVPDPEQEPPAAATARALQRLGPGGTSLAQVEMEILGRKAGPPGRLALARWYSERGNITLAAETAMAVLREMPSPAAYRLAYPLAYADLVEQEGAEFGVDPLLIWAVMREESHFAPWAVSRAGACGLMQLMPDTAARAARALGMSVQREDLFRPEINLRLGTWYLARLLEACGGDVPRALAAYNGGLGNVRRWAASPTFRGREGFPAAITFSETREYLTRVAQSYLVYQYLYGDGGDGDSGLRTPAQRGPRPPSTARAARPASALNRPCGARAGGFFPAPVPPDPARPGEIDRLPPPTAPAGTPPEWPAGGRSARPGA
jgi:soluble lytic murein transglycosylase